MGEVSPSVVEDPAYPVVVGLGPSVVVQPGDTLLVGLGAGVTDAAAAVQIEVLEKLPELVPGVEVVVVRGLTTLGVVRYGEEHGEDQAHELVAAREELIRVRAAAQQRVDDLIAEVGRGRRVLGQHLSAWARLIAAAVPNVDDPRVAEALRSMERFANELDPR